MSKNQLFATALQYSPGGRTNGIPVYTILGFPNETFEQLAGRIEEYVDRQYRKVNGPSGYTYEILLGEITHELEPPKPKTIKVYPREFKDPATVAAAKPARKLLKSA